MKIIVVPIRTTHPALALLASTLASLLQKKPNEITFDDHQELIAVKNSFKLFKREGIILEGDHLKYFRELLKKIAMAMKMQRKFCQKKGSWACGKTLDGKEEYRERHHCPHSRPPYQAGARP
ncbi:MAG: hypothetical protein WAW90_01035 [Minisyncoccia bacterium]